MKKIARASAYLFSGLIVLMISAIGTLIFCMPMLGEQNFRADFGAVQQYYTARTDTDRALSLGGRSGLSRLQKLSEDQNIAPVGRTRALILIQYIQSGAHVTDLKQEIEQSKKYDHGLALRDYYACFVIWKDED